MKPDFSKIVTAAHKAEAARLERLRIAQSAALAFLAETDWMVIRASEGGKPLPPEVAKSRKTARETAQR